MNRLNVLVMDANPNQVPTNVTGSCYCSEEHEQLKTFVGLIKEELQTCSTRNKELSSSVGTLQEQLRAAQATISMFDKSLLTSRQVSAASASRPDTESTAHDEVEQVCEELLLRMQHQVLRQRNPAAALPAGSHAGASAAEDAGHSVENMEEAAGSTCSGGRCASTCTEESCKLSLEQAHREIEERRREIDALDNTVGELIVEIMDMLVNVSSFHRDHMQVRCMHPCPHRVPRACAGVCLRQD